MQGDDEQIRAVQRRIAAEAKLTAAEPKMDVVAVSTANSSAEMGARAPRRRSSNVQHNAKLNAVENRAGDVIQRLRALTKKTDLQNAPLDINDVIHDVVNLMRREVSNHRVNLRLDLHSGLDQVLGDRVQLQQVIINLIVSGIAAMANMEEQRELLIRVRQHDPHFVLVAVRDSGVGIPTDQLDRVFNAFFSTKANGMGMGLSICRSIVEAHGGSLWASCNEGAGVTFQFTVPSMAGL
jgi:signal transduction histidine kinase